MCIVIKITMFVDGNMKLVVTLPENLVTIIYVSGYKST